MSGNIRPLNVIIGVNGIGMGHTVRQSVIAQYLRDRGHEVRIVTNGQGRVEYFRDLGFPAWDGWMPTLLARDDRIARDAVARNIRQTPGGLANTSSCAGSFGDRCPGRVRHRLRAQHSTPRLPLRPTADLRRPAEQVPAPGPPGRRPVRPDSRRAATAVLRAPRRPILHLLLRPAGRPTTGGWSSSPRSFPTSSAPRRSPPSPSPRPTSPATSTTARRSPSEPSTAVFRQSVPDRDAADLHAADEIETLRQYADSQDRDLRLRPRGIHRGHGALRGRVLQRRLQPHQRSLRPRQTGSIWSRCPPTTSTGAPRSSTRRNWAPRRPRIDRRAVLDFLNRSRELPPQRRTPPGPAPRGRPP